MVDKTSVSSQRTATMRPVEEGLRRGFPEALKPKGSTGLRAFCCLLLFPWRGSKGLALDVFLQRLQRDSEVGVGTLCRDFGSQP